MLTPFPVSLLRGTPGNEIQRDEGSRGGVRGVWETTISRALRNQRLAQTNSVARMESPMGRTTNAGPGRTSRATPIRGTVPPMIAITIRLARRRCGIFCHQVCLGGSFSFIETDGFAHELTIPGEANPPGLAAQRTSGAAYFAGSTCTASICTLPFAPAALIVTAASSPALNLNLPMEWNPGAISPALV